MHDNHWLHHQSFSCTLCFTQCDPVHTRDRLLWQPYLSPLHITSFMRYWYPMFPHIRIIKLARRHNELSKSIINFFSLTQKPHILCKKQNQKNYTDLSTTIYFTYPLFQTTVSCRLKCSLFIMLRNQIPNIYFWPLFPNINSSHPSVEKSISHWQPPAFSQKHMLIITFDSYRYVISVTQKSLCFPINLWKHMNQ